MLRFCRASAALVGGAFTQGVVTASLILVVAHRAGRAEDTMIELAEVIRQLREELDIARTSATDAVLQFEMGTIELEVMVALEKDISAGLKVRFWVVDLGADTRAMSSSTHRIKLTLQPTVPVASQQPDSGPRVSAYVSGDEVAGER